MHSTASRVKVWWKETTHPKEILFSFCLNSLSLPQCFPPSEVSLFSSNCVSIGRLTLEAVSS